MQHLIQTFDYVHPSIYRSVVYGLDGQTYYAVSAANDEAWAATTCCCCDLRTNRSQGHGIRGQQGAHLQQRCLIMHWFTD